MSEQKPKKPIMILSLDTETGGFNAEVNALMTVGLATLELEDANDLGKIKKKEWLISNRYIVVEKTPRVITENPCYVEKEALECNKLNTYELETHGTPIKEVESDLCEYLGKLTSKFRVHLLGQNLKFDLGFVAKNMPTFFDKLNGLTTHHELRTLSMAFNVFNHKNDGYTIVDLYSKSTSMDNMRKLLKIESSGQTHSAAVDAEDNIKVFVKLLNKFEIMR